MVFRFRPNDIASWISFCQVHGVQSHLKKKFHRAFLKYKRLKLKLREFLAGHSVAMVTYCVTKIIPPCSPVSGQFFHTMIVASTDKEWL